MMVFLATVGGAALWMSVGILSLLLWSKLLPRYFDMNDGEDVSMFMFMWPIMHIVAVCFSASPVKEWIKKRWKTFRASKIEKKKKSAAKIRMCPALKLKKYEELLTKIETMHNRYYYHYIDEHVTEFARIRDGKPQVNDWAARQAAGQVVPGLVVANVPVWMDEPAQPQAELPVGIQWVEGEEPEEGWVNEDEVYNNVVHMPEPEPNDERW